MTLRSLVGTPIYMAPEFFRSIDGDQGVRYKSLVDIYSMAMVIYQVYTGVADSRTFYPTAHTYPDLMGPKATGKKIKMDKLKMVVHSQVAVVIDRAMNADLNMMPSLGEFKEAIEIEGAPGVAHGLN